jgi:hypothetical protein
VICIVGDAEDLSGAYVAWLVERRGEDVRVLPEATLGVDWWIEWGETGGEVVTGSHNLSFDAITGAFVRLNPRPPVPDELGVPDDGEVVFVAERRNGLQWWLDTAPFPVVNPPRSGRSNGSKPFQMLRLAELGCDVPPWCATNVVDVARQFLDDHPVGVVYKACSGLRSHVRIADSELLDRLAGGTAPVLLQRYVAGTEARVHVVGDEVFATEIRSASVDYRWSTEPPEYRLLEVPDLIGKRCRQVATVEGLSLAGIDFRIDANGRWWWLEVNPVPTFLPYEAATGHPIGDAVIDLLTPVRGRVERSSLARSFTSSRD